MSPRLTSFWLGVAAGAAGVSIFILVLIPRVRPATRTSAPAIETNSLSAYDPNTSKTAFDWRTVESEDYRNYITNLRDIGCPEETIRDIIIADVNKLFEGRRRSLFAAKSTRYEYWKSSNQRFARAFDEQKLAEQQALAKERRTVLKELLGFEPEEKLDFVPWNPLEDMLDFLPPPKRIAIMEFEQRFNARRIKLMGGGTGMNVLKVLEKQREVEVAKLLSPDEMEEYRVRRSETAMRMTSELEAFEPSEQEFREIYKLRSQIEDEFGASSTGMLTSEATAKLEEGLKDLLGPSRYVDYEHSQEYAYRTIYGLAIRNGFDKDAADRVFDLKRAVGDQVKTVRADSSLTPEQRAAALLRIRRETEQSVRTVFDGEAFLTFHSQTGNWLNDISPDSP